MQQRHSLLSATARRLLLLKVCPDQDYSTQSLTLNEPTTGTLQLERLRDIVKEKYPELRVEKNVDEQWVVISR